MAIFDVNKFNEMQTDEIHKMYTPEMYKEEWEKTEKLESELFELMNKDENSFDEFVNNNEPLATFDYISSMYTTEYMCELYVIPVRTLKRVRQQITDKINIINLKKSL